METSIFIDLPKEQAFGFIDFFFSTVFFSLKN
jgi:hypothetical protein